MHHFDDVNHNFRRLLSFSSSSFFFYFGKRIYMTKAIRSAAIFLLLITGIAACYGGLSLIVDPTGESLGLSLNQLKFLPYRTYFVPGIILLGINGISSLFVALWVAKKRKHAGILVSLQGIVLTAWILVQFQPVPYYFLQYFFAAGGVLLIAFGIILSNLKFSFR